jgi:hypothetical protein
MTRRPPHLPKAPSDVDLGKTRSRFLLARAQTCAHAPAADYMRIRGLDRIQRDR